MSEAQIPADEFEETAFELNNDPAYIVGEDEDVEVLDGPTDEPKESER